MEIFYQWVIGFSPALAAYKIPQEPSAFVFNVISQSNRLINNTGIKEDLEINHFVARFDGAVLIYMVTVKCYIITTWCLIKCKAIDAML